MEAKHSARAGSARAQEAGPSHTEPRHEPTPAQAIETVRTILEPTWERTFHHHTLDDGSVLYVDPVTGQTYDTLPKMHDADGKDL